MTSKTTTPETATATLPIQTKHLAVRFGIKTTQLRRVLRSMPEYADGVHTNYRWAENDKRISAIESQIKKLEKDKFDRKAAATAALESRKAKAAKQAEVDKKAGVPAVA
jgi:hypothetical protein